MKKRSSFFLLVAVIALAACDPLPVQYPPGSSPYPYPAQGAGGAPLPQAREVTGSQRWAHAWGKAMEGVAMGGAIGGPYGAGGGLVIGLLTGLLTADSHYGQINNQIHAEQRKDQQLEAAIEQELARQRELENQIAKAELPSPAGAQPTQPVSTKTQPQRPAPTQVPPPPVRASESTGVAALTKPTATQPAPSPFKNVEVRDVNGDGVPDLWIYYNPQRPGEIIRQEEACVSDGPRENPLTNARNMLMAVISGDPATNCIVVIKVNSTK